MVHGFCCLVACGNSSRLGIEPASPALAVHIRCTTREVRIIYFFIKTVKCKISSLKGGVLSLYNVGNLVEKSNVCRMRKECVLLFSPWIMSYSLWAHRLHHARLLCPSLPPRVCSDSCPLSQWCSLTILSSATPFSLCLQSFPASGIF